MINVNMIEAQRMIQEVVKSRFEALYDCYEDDAGKKGAYNPNIVNTPLPPYFKPVKAATESTDRKSVV